MRAQPVRAAMAAIVAAVTLIPASRVEAALPQGVSAGDVTQSAAVLWAATDTVGDVIFDLATDPAFGNILATATVSVTDPLVPARVAVTGLSPATRYYYRATDASMQTRTGTFRTPAAPGAARQGFRLGVSGDWRGELSPYPAIRNVPDRGLDLFVKLGDTIYADVPSPAVPIPQCLTLTDFRLKHAEVYSARFGLDAWGDAHAATPVLAMIDDHEVTNDFIGGAPPASHPLFAGDPAPFINQTQLFRRALQAFIEYNAVEDLVWSEPNDPRLDGVSKLYRSRTYGRDAAVFLLDARSFRDPGLPAANPLDPNSIGAYVVASFTPGRTLLGVPQLAQLKADLLAAQQACVTWKFVHVPEPIQNLGVVNASDRFEGFAWERTDLLRFIRDNSITNVVFVAADFHGTLINNVQYTDGPFTPQISLGAFEVVTGAVAYHEPFGPTIAGLAFSLGFPGAISPAQYAALPAPQKEAYIQNLINLQMVLLGYSPLGLQDADLRGVQLLAGTWTATNTYGWTEFDVDPVTQKLTVTTYGVDYYSESQLLADPAGVVARVPQVVSQFSVLPTFRRGDVDCSGCIDFDDIDAFVAALGGQAGYQAQYPSCVWQYADVNGDGVVNFDDIDPFVALLGS
ncbi:MAG: alkaline phosphatase D family protein [Phycisphaerales bacterium]|nr:alkaline phosphatase D family protein [Phycisphaerales bacterium]